MKRIIPLSFAVVFAALPGLVQAQTYNLSGEWEAPFTTDYGFRVEQARIRQNGNSVQATKLTGDEYVPAGTMNVRGVFNSNPFAAEQVCAGLGLEGAHWEKITITVLDRDHFKVTGGCSGDVIWKRLPGPHIS